MLSLKIYKSIRKDFLLETYKTQRFNPLTHHLLIKSYVTLLSAYVMT